MPKVRGTINLPDVPVGAFYGDDGTFHLISGSMSLFDRSQIKTTSDIIQENFYTYTLPAGTLANDGDKIEWHYAGIFQPSTNFKRVFTEFAGTILLTGQTNVAAATNWLVDVYLIRVSNSVIEYAAEFTTTGDYPIIASGAVAGLDLANVAYAIDLDARSPSAAGEVTARSGYGIFYPSATPISGDVYEGLLSSADVYEGLISSGDSYEGVI